MERPSVDTVKNIDKVATSAKLEGIRTANELREIREIVQDRFKVLREDSKKAVESSLKAVDRVTSLDEKLIDLREEVDKKANASTAATKDDLSRLRLAFVEGGGGGGNGGGELTMSPLLDEVFSVLKRKADNSYVEEEVGSLRREVQKMGNVMEGRTERKLRAVTDANEKEIEAVMDALADMKAVVKKTEEMQGSEVKEKLAEQEAAITTLSGRVDAVKDMAVSKPTASETSSIALAVVKEAGKKVEDDVEKMKALLHSVRTDVSMFEKAGVVGMKAKLDQTAALLDNALPYVVRQDQLQNILATLVTTRDSEKQMDRIRLLEQEVPEVRRKAETLRGDVRTLEGRQDTFETMMTAVQAVEKRVDKLADTVDAVKSSVGTVDAFDDSRLREEMGELQDKILAMGEKKADAVTLENAISSLEVKMLSEIDNQKADGAKVKKLLSQVKAQVVGVSKASVDRETLAKTVRKLKDAYEESIDHNRNDIAGRCLSCSPPSKFQMKAMLGKVGASLDPRDTLPPKKAAKRLDESSFEIDDVRGTTGKTMPKLSENEKKKYDQRLARTFPRTGWEEAGVSYTVAGSDKHYYRARADMDGGGKKKGGSRLPSIHHGDDLQRKGSPSSGWEASNSRPDSQPEAEFTHMGPSPLSKSATLSSIEGLAHTGEGAGAEKGGGYGGERSHTSLSGAITPMVSSLAADSPELLPPLGRNAASSTKKMKRGSSEKAVMPPISA
uniref:Uncharacterized protein n=1 Tax=Palpitomonas bilix TaxID=652834 RepID=A0A7S3GI55_9EUKA